MPLRAERDRRKAGGQVDGRDRVPLLVLHAHEQTVARHAGVVDEDVERPIAASAAGTSFFDRGRIGKIAGHDERALSEVGGERVERLAPGAGQHDFRALRMQGARRWPSRGRRWRR